MEAYVDYSFYSNTFKGSTIPDAAFEQCALRASRHIDLITFGRIQDFGVSDEILIDVKLATCAAAEALYKVGQHDDVASETVGKVSVTYKDNSVEGSMTSAVEPYLFKTGLLSRCIPNRGWD